VLALWILLAAAAPADEAAAPPAPAASDRADAASADRLRRMLGEQGQAPLALREVLDSVDARHPRMLAALLGIERARGGLMSARGAFDPSFKASASSMVLGYYGYTFADSSVSWGSGAARIYGGWRTGVDAWEREGIPQYYGEYETQDRGEVRLGVSLPLLRDVITDSSRAGLRTALAERDRADAAADGVDVDLRQTATGAWAGWVAAGRGLALERALYEIAETRQRAVAARVQLGDLAALEELRAAQFLERRRASLERAQGSFEASIEGLGLYLRDAGGAPIRVDAARLPPREAVPEAPLARDVDALRALARDRHPGLRALRAVVAQREASARLARNRQLPQLDAYGEVAQDLASGTDATVDKLAPMSLSVGVKGGFSALQRPARGAAIAADAALETAEADLRWLTERIDAAVIQAVARERAALEAWRAASRSVDLALGIQEAEQRRFDLGEIDLLRLWQIEQETASSVTSEISAWASYQAARAAVIAAVGGELPGGP
jgi:outer membrane protein TolC